MVECTLLLSADMVHKKDQLVQDAISSGGSRISHWGDADLQHTHFLEKTYAKTKELGSVRGRVCTGSAPCIRQWYP